MPVSWIDYVPLLIVWLIALMIIGLATPDLQAPNVQAQAEDYDWGKWRCPSNIPTPSITASVSSTTTTSASISASYTTVSMANYSVTHSFYWNDGNRNTSRTVTSEGTYKATVDAVFERDGNICERSDSDSVTVKFIKPTPTPTQTPCPGRNGCQPTPTPTPTPEPTLEPCGSSNAAPTCVPTPEPTQCGRPCIPTPRPTKTKGPTPVPTDTPEPGATNTPTPRPNPNPGPSRPIAPTELKARANNTTLSDRDSKGTITMELVWNPVSGSGVTYDVLKDLGAGRWEVVGSGITGTDALVPDLPPETEYSYGVRAHRSGKTSNVRGVTFTTPIPFLGRQRDHTVRYVLGTINPMPPIGQYVPDHAQALTDAVAAWNSIAAATASDGPRLLICESVLCGTRNRDRNEVTISYPTGVHRSGRVSIAGDCRASFACVQHKRPDDDGLLKAATLALEEPAWEKRGGGNSPDDVRIVWTNEAHLHAMPVENKPPLTKFKWEYFHLPTAIMHEFGHTLGLADLYKLSYRNFPGHIMDEAKDRVFHSIPTLDNDYLESVYEHHEPY